MYCMTEYYIGMTHPLEWSQLSVRIQCVAPTTSQLSIMGCLINSRLVLVVHVATGSLASAVMCHVWDCGDESEQV